MFNLLRHPSPQYTKLPISTSPSSPFKTKAISLHSLRLFIPTFLVLLSLTISFLLGRHSHTLWPRPISFTLSTSPSPSAISLTTAPKLFTYNRTFGESSERAEYAWLHLFPSRGGYFTHPTLAPNRSAISVFHQLHCLNGLRSAYWSLYSHATTNGTLLDEDEIRKVVGHEGRPAHVRHCVDLLRQSLMCNPDLTFEVKDEKRGGVTGFGTVHQCKSWEGLVGWVREWEDWGLGEEEKEEGTGGGSHHGHHRQ